VSPRRTIPPLWLFALALVLAGCGGGQNTLEPHSHPARRIATLWWVMMGAAWFGFGVVVLLLALGWFRRHRENLPFGHGERTATALVIALGIGVPAVVLSALFVWADIFVMRSTAAPRPGQTRLTIDVTGHQWFWEVRYPGTAAVTANEIHIPVGVPVRVVARTADVIHSFWVPELNRKIDMIPGRANTVELDADSPGVYRGQCAEFCGLQHAHMSMLVFAEPRAKFDAWLAAQEKPARTGSKVFMTHSCGACHTIRGTSARGEIGPDLTHVASRRTLAANTIPNRRDELRDWILDPDHVKPGVKMPSNRDLSRGELDALVSYLEGLK
jgi:cytochrome c oxidase subunit 2